MNAIELRDYYCSRREAHELLAAQAGESYIAKIHLDLAARYALLIDDQPQAGPDAADQRDEASISLRADTLSDA